jgi:hypothetical protein
MTADSVLPTELVEIAQQMAQHPGVPVDVSSSVLKTIDSTFHESLSESLRKVRERERNVPSEALKLRLR